MKDTIYLIKINTTEEFKELCKEHLGAPVLAADLETSGFDFMVDKIGCITLGFNKYEGFYTPWALVDKVALNELFASAKFILGANFKFDVRFLWWNGIPSARIDGDTVQLGHVLNEQRRNGLKTHAFIYSPFGGYDRDLDRYREKTGVENYLLIPEHIMIPYATMDVIVVQWVYEAEQLQLTEVDKKYPNEKNPSWSMRRYYEDIMMPAVNAFAKIEYRGVYINKEALAQSRKEILEEIEEIEAFLRETWNLTTDFDFNSPKVLGTLFENLGFEDFGRAKSGVFLTSDGQLERWAQSGHPEIKKLQKLRSLKTVLKSFIRDRKSVV